MVVCMDNKFFWTPETQLYYEREKIISAKNNILIDSNNKEYIDLNSGTWNVFLGHGRKEFLNVLYKQADNLDFVSNHRFYHEQGDKLAKRIIDLFPPNMYSSVFFTSGGSEAVESALKISKQYFYNKHKEGKHRFISLFESYHGSTLGSAGISGDPWDRVPFDDLFIESIHIHPQYCYRCGLGLSKDICKYACIKDFEYRLDFYGEENICALIIEPVMGVGGVVIPDEYYLNRLIEVCHKNDILVIFDEVSTGFGRTGEYFNCIKRGVYPDIITFGKTVSNGVVPLGGMIVSKRIADAFVSQKAENQFRHGFTNSGHPLACAVGNAVLDVFEKKNIIEEVKTKSESFRALISNYTYLQFFGEVRIEGLMIAMEIVDPVTKQTVNIPNLDIILRNKGFLISQLAGVVALFPSVITTENEMESFMKILVEVLNEFFYMQ